MNKLTARHCLIAGIAIVALLALPSAGLATHSWANYHWARTSNPFTIKLGDNVASKWDAFLSQASSDWSQSNVLDTTVVNGGTKPKSCRPTSGQVEVCSSRYGNTGWLGVAQIYASGDHITQGTVKLNDYYHDNAPYNQPEWRAMVTCQEVGHTFGLDHQDENFNNSNLGTCMDYTSDPLGPPSNEHPNKHDYDQLAAIYSHLDSTTTVAASTFGQQPSAMNDIDFSGPAQWGKLIAMSEDGGQAVFELDFGHGHKVVTFVTWTNDMAQQMRDWRDGLAHTPAKK